jgi:hypothetical protein
MTLFNVYWRNDRDVLSSALGFTLYIRSGSNDKDAKVHRKRICPIVLLRLLSISPPSLMLITLSVLFIVAPF